MKQNKERGKWSLVISLERKKRKTPGFDSQPGQTISKEHSRKELKVVLP